MSDRTVRLDLEFDIGDMMDDDIIDNDEAEVLYRAFDKTIKAAELEFANMLVKRPPKRIQENVYSKYQAPLQYKGEKPIIDAKKRNMIFAMITSPAVLVSIFRLMGLI